MIPEKSVFVAQHGIHRSGGNIGQTGVDAVFLIGRKAHAHDAAAFVEHHARKSHTFQRVGAGSKSNPEQQGHQRQGKNAQHGHHAPSAP